MSEYFKFYLVGKEGDGAFESLGPWYMNDDNELVPMPLMNRSRNEMYGLREHLTVVSKAAKVDEAMREIFYDDDCFEAYWVSVEDILHLARNKGLKEGYVLKERLDEIYKNQCSDVCDAYIDDNEYVSIRRYAEMSDEERKLYTYHRWFDRESKEYLADQLATTVLNYYRANMFYPIEYVSDNELYLLVKRY